MNEDEALVMSKYLSSLTEEMRVQAIMEHLMVLGEEQLSDKQLYWNGVKAGVERYAYWRDGRRYVGAGVLTLHQALQEVDEDMRRALSNDTQHK